jgi:hypothetical protein
MVHITGLIKSALSTYLPMIEDTSALASLLTQLQYCGMSLGRIGLDFRHIFVHSFEEAVHPMILKWIDATTEELVALISKATEEASAPSTWMSSKIVSQNSNATNSDQIRRHAFQPPMLLVGYPSLAIFTNDVLSAFNALRLLPAIRLYEPILNHLESCFLDIGLALKQYCDQAISHIPDEITYLQSYTAAYVRCCLPYLKSCLVDGIYGDLSNLKAADEDMEELLAAYLSVIKKEGTQAEETKETTVEIGTKDEAGSEAQDPSKDDGEKVIDSDLNASVNTENDAVLEELKNNKDTGLEIAMEEQKPENEDTDLETLNPEITENATEDLSLCNSSTEEIKEEQPTFAEQTSSDEQLVETEEPSSTEKQVDVDSSGDLEERELEQVPLKTEESNLETEQSVAVDQAKDEPVIDKTVDTLEFASDAPPDTMEVIEESNTILET